jgi:hypothetical protein
MQVFVCLTIIAKSEGLTPMTTIDMGEFALKMRASMVASISFTTPSCEGSPEETTSCYDQYNSPQTLTLGYNNNNIYSHDVQLDT